MSTVPVQLLLLNEHLIAGGNHVPLTRREVCFLGFMARRRVPWAREEIQDALWPDLDARSGRDSLYSLVHRLRKRIAPGCLVRSAGNAYAIDDSVRVDLWEMDDVYTLVQRRKPVAIERVRDAFNSLRDRTCRSLKACEWFRSVEFQLDDYQRTLVKHLIACAEHQRNYSEVAYYAEELLNADGTDEWAHKVIIQAHLAMGQELDAARAYRKYRAVLRRELNVEPSEEFAEVAQMLSGFK